MPVQNFVALRRSARGGEVEGDKTTFRITDNSGSRPWDSQCFSASDTEWTRDGLL